MSSFKRIFISKHTLEDLYIKQQLSLIQIGKLHNLTASGVLRKMRKFNIVMRPFWTSRVSIRQPFDGSDIEKSYLIGFRLGDLGIRQKSQLSRYIRVGCNTTKIEQAELINDLFSKYSKVSIGKPSPRNVISVSTILHSSFEFLLPKRDLIEPWIISEPKNILAFMAGYIDAEGSFGVYQNRARFRIGSYDVGILQQFFTTLINLDIKAKLSLEMAKTPVGARNITRKLNCDFWRLSINEKESLLNFSNLIIPFLKHKKRIADLKRAKLNAELRMMI